MRVLMVILFLIQTGLCAQGRPAKPGMASGKKPAGVQKPAISNDTISDDPADTLDPRDLDYKAWREFAVYNKRGRGKDRSLKLCYQLISENAVLNRCVNDSTIKDPEVFKEIFRRQEGDSIYALLYIDALTKDITKVCSIGHETRLVFFKWDTKTNTSRMQQRTIASCLKAVTRMDTTDVLGWDGSTPLNFEYHWGGRGFRELSFDPGNYRAGLKYVKNDTGDDD